MPSTQKMFLFVNEQAAIDVIQSNTPWFIRPAMTALLATWATVFGVISLVYLLQGFTACLCTACPLLAILTLATFFGITTLVKTQDRVQAKVVQIGETAFKRNSVHKRLLDAARAGKREKDDDDDSETDDDDELDEVRVYLFFLPVMIWSDPIAFTGSARRDSRAHQENPQGAISHFVSLRLTDVRYAEFGQTYWRFP